MKVKIKAEIESRISNIEYSAISSPQREGAKLALNSMLDFINSLPEEPVSEDLEEAAKHYLYSNILYDDVYVGNPTDEDCIEMFKAGAKWRKEHLWKPADGDDLPEIDREVVVFTQDFPNDAGIMTVAIGHRPNPEGWDGKSLSTGKVEHYMPQCYDRGGWNIPNVKYWLDTELPFKDE